MATEESIIWQKDSVDFYFCQTNRPILLQSIRSSTRIKHQLCDPPGVSSSRQFLYIIASISRERGNRLFRLGLTSNGLLVTLGKGLGLTLLAVLLPKQRNPSVKITFGALFFRYRCTNLPFGKLQVHLATALRGSTGAFLEGPANCAGRHGEVAVVTIRKKHHPLAH